MMALKCIWNIKKTSYNWVARKWKITLIFYLPKPESKLSPTAVQWTTHIRSNMLCSRKSVTLEGGYISSRLPVEETSKEWGPAMRWNASTVWAVTAEKYEPQQKSSGPENYTKTLIIKLVGIGRLFSSSSHALL